MTRQRMSRYGREFAQDLRYSVRLLGRSPTFALTAIATLALGIAVNVTIFSFINGIFLRPLNVPESERVAALYHWSTRGSGSLSSTSYPDYEHYRDHARSFAEIRRRIGMLDRNVTLRDPRTVRMHLDTAFSQERMATVLVGGLGLLALALASVGLYGVIGAAVARRTRECGVRIAVGASAREIVSMVLWKALLLAGSGLAIGIGLALVLARAIRSQLFGVAPSDFASFAFASALLAAVAIVAAWLPARRAAKVAPVTALRAEWYGCNAAGRSIAL